MSSHEFGIPIKVLDAEDFWGGLSLGQFSYMVPHGSLATALMGSSLILCSVVFELTEWVHLAREKMISNAMKPYPKVSVSL